MGVLQDQCPEEDFATVKGIVSKELDFDNVFAAFEEKPIGAASIGQGELGPIGSTCLDSIEMLA